MRFNEKIMSFASFILLKLELTLSECKRNQLNSYWNIIRGYRTCEEEPPLGLSSIFCYLLLTCSFLRFTLKIPNEPIIGLQSKPGLRRFFSSLALNSGKVQILYDGFFEQF